MREAVPHDQLMNYQHRIIVAGSRGYNDRHFFDKALLHSLIKFDLGEFTDFIFLSGKASSGADQLVIEFAIDNDMDWAEYPAQWEKVDPKTGQKVTDRGAGHRRNAEMREDATHLVVFWDGKSRGTKEMIEGWRKKYPTGNNLSVVLIDIK